MWQEASNFTGKAEELKNWLLSNPRNRFVPFGQIPRLAPELDLGHCGGKAIRRAFKSQGYGRRISKRKGFSDTPEHRQRRLEFAVAAIQWTPERLSQQMFSDEVWAHGGANTRRSVTVLVAGDRQDIVMNGYEQFKGIRCLVNLERKDNNDMIVKTVFKI